MILLETSFFNQVFLAAWPKPTQRATGWENSKQASSNHSVIITACGLDKMNTVYVIVHKEMVVSELYVYFLQYADDIYMYNVVPLIVATLSRGHPL